MAKGAVFAGRYRISRLLGEGDRKRTYLAYDTVLHRHVALALIRATAARDDPAGTRREAEALALAFHGDLAAERRLNGEVLLNWDDVGCRGPYPPRFEEHFLRERYRMVARS